MSAAEDWQVALEALAVPKEILEEAPDSPWTLPIEPFRQRAQTALAGESSPSLDKARVFHEGRRYRNNFMLHCRAVKIKRITAAGKRL